MGRSAKRTRVATRLAGSSISRMRRGMVVDQPAGVIERLCTGLHIAHNSERPRGQLQRVDPVEPDARAAVLGNNTHTNLRIQQVENTCAKVASATETHQKVRRKEAHLQFTDVCSLLPPELDNQFHRSCSSARRSLSCTRGENVPIQALGPLKIRGTRCYQCSEAPGLSQYGVVQSLEEFGGIPVPLPGARETRSKLQLGRRLPAGTHAPSQIHVDCA